MNKYFRPRRSMLYVPGYNPKYLEKARNLPVDSVILDLGDPVLVKDKELARENVVRAVKEGGYGRREVVIRVNDLDSPWGADDIAAVAQLGADAVLFPNITSRADVLRYQAALDAAGGQDLPIMVMIENPLAVLRAEEICSASERIACIVMATSDLKNHLHARRTFDRTPILTSLSLVLLAARAYKRAVVDGISTDIKDMEAFEYACRFARDLGLDGKSLVHPNQLPYCNDAFTPKQSEIESAVEVISALEKANQAGRATVVLHGKMVEQHIVDSAKRLLTLNDAINALQAEVEV